MSDENDKNPTMLDQIKKIHEKILAWTPEELAAFQANFQKYIDERHQKDEAFWNSERKTQIKEYVEWWVTKNGRLGDNVYQEPLLEAYDKWPSVSNEDFVNLVSLTLDKNQDRQTSDKENPFENEIVEIDGFSYGVMHGQGSYFWVDPKE